MYDEDTLSDIVHAYGGAHVSVPYEDAVDMAAFSKENDSELMLARVSEDAFELLDFGGESRADSEYVTLAVGRRLYSEGRVGVMVLWHDQEDEPQTEEDFAARRHAQVFGDYDESL